MDKRIEIHDINNNNNDNDDNDELLFVKIDRGVSLKEKIKFFRV